MTVLPDDELPLAAEFPDATREQWQHLVEGVLRKAGREDVQGEAAEQALTSSRQDGLKLLPLYTADNGVTRDDLPGSGTFVRGSRPEGNTASGWDVRQRHATTDPKQTNEAVLADLENGAGSVWLAVGEHGIPVASLAAALEGVYLDLAAVALDTGGDSREAAEELIRLYETRGVARSAATGNLGADPLGRLARSGVAEGLERMTADAAELAALCRDELPGVRALVVDALPYHEAGGSPAQELGCSLATGVAYLRALTAAGLSAEEAAAQLEFRYAAGADQFLTVATFRAARKLWARVAEVCGVTSQSGTAAAQRQHAVTSTVMTTRRDPWVNMLRATVATLGAGVGGADAITVLPFDEALGLPDAFARRIARNTSSVLIEESHLARVIDPAGGSWYVERLTEELAEAAWAWFQEIEAAGGQEAALRSGLIAERLAVTWAERSAKLAKRREPITGVSEFPHLAEKPVIREPAPAPLSGGLPRVRRDEAFEALRARSDAHLAATGSRPRIFLAGIGPAAAHTARASFASNFFQTAGIEPVHEPVSVDADTADAALVAAGTDFAVLCSSDKLYAEQGEALAGALKAAGAVKVFLAGRPGEQRAALESAGVDEFVFAGSDAVAVLTSVLDQMGVA